MTLPTTEIKDLNEYLKQLISYYEDILKTDGYKTSDVFERIRQRMREDERFTATELAVGLCIAYDDNILPLVIKEVIRFSPHIFSVLEKMGLKVDISEDYIKKLRDIISQ